MKVKQGRGDGAFPATNPTEVLDTKIGQNTSREACFFPRRLFSGFARNLSDSDLVTAGLFGDCGMRTRRDVIIA